MNLKVYYQKLRQTEANISEPFVVVVSHEAPDGGRAGVLTETPREIAARMIVEGIARLASEDEAAAFREEIKERKRQAEQAAVASRLQVTVVSEGDLKKPGAHQKGSKSH